MDGPGRVEKEDQPAKSVFPEFEIVIEEEVGTPSTLEERVREDEALLRKYQDVYVTDVDEDAKLGQRDLDEMSGAKLPVKDSQTIRFLTTIDSNPEQVIRYARWEDGQPLWVSSESVPGRKDVPSCERCGAKRDFEFQVMPQLLHYLRVDSKAVMPTSPDQPGRLGAMDWGTLAVYTCTRSCSASKGPGYVEEFVWRQKALD